MIYRNLRTLPYLTCLEIIETGDITLLSTEPWPDDTPIDELVELWVLLYERFKEISNPKEHKKVFILVREIDYLAHKYNVIKSACDGLLFEHHNEMIEMLQNYGYSITDRTYVEDINRILRESEGIITKVNDLKRKLPQERTGDTTEEYPVIRVMAAYMAVLGIDFDFNTISVEKFFAVEEQVQQKVANIEKQNAKNKNR